MEPTLCRRKSVMEDQEGSSISQVRVLLGKEETVEEVDIPESLIEDRELFRSVLSVESWRHLLSEEDKERLKALGPTGSSIDLEEMLRFATSTEEIRFGTNPVDVLQEKLASGSLTPSVWEAEEKRKRLLMQQYKFNQADYFVELLQELLVSRQVLLQRALSAGSLENMWKENSLDQEVVEGEKKRGRQGRRDQRSAVDQECEQVLREIAEEGASFVSGEEEDDDENLLPAISEEQYRGLLRGHRRRRRNCNVSYLSKLEHLSEAAGWGFTGDTPSSKRSCFALPSGVTVEEGPVISTSFPSRKHPRAEQEVGMPRKEVSSGGGRRGRRTIRERSQHEGTTQAQAQAIYEVYTPIDNGMMKDPPIKPIILEGPLPEGKSKSFFSLLKAVFDSITDRKGELGKLTKILSQMLRSPDYLSCSWLNDRSDWVDHTLSALCYLSAEVGAVSSFKPLPHFIPLIDFRDRVDNWKWIGSGRDSEWELLVLCNHWMDHLDQTLPVVDYSDYEPPPPHVWTNKSFVQSTPTEIAKFQQMERERYAAPHKAYTYNIRGYESPVGPVKGAKVTKRDSSSKARGHALLVPNRPNCVTILSLVRDATSRLPNGEGTRLDLCIQVQDSQYIADFVSDTQLNNAVSGALDRLHYEKDPCVRYDGTRKVWIYLHRGRNTEDFERIHWACEVAAKQRKMLISRPKIKPKIILRTDGKDEVLEQGYSPSLTEDIGNSSKLGKKVSGSRVGTASQQQSTIESVVTPGTPHLLQPGHLSLVVASVVQGKQDMGRGGVLTLQLTQQKPREPQVDDDQHLRKRKQSLKVAELLQEEAMSPSPNDTPLFQPSPSSSGTWNTEDSGGEEQGKESTVVAGKDVSLGEGEWSRPPDASPNSSD